MKKKTSEPESEMLTGLTAPARRALMGAGYLRAVQFAKLSEADLLALHGMGPNALKQIRRTLAAKGKSLAGESKKKN